MKNLEILLVCILSIYGIILGSKWEKISNAKRTFVVISVLAALIIAYDAYCANQKEIFLEKVNAKVGDIGDFKNDKNTTYPEVKIGTNVTLVLGDGTLSLPGFPQLFKIEAKNNKLIFSGIVRDANGDVIAAILENVWKIYSNNYEYNNDDNAFEIVTVGDSRVFYKVELKNGIAYFSGYIFNKNKEGVYFFPSSNGTAGLRKIDSSNKDSTYEYIAPIFKYPREKYLGIRK